ncbi:histidine kinase dimerization/phosphoacceptor domain-containing protein, partial [Streptomyces sp. 2MCAF27]
MLRHDARLQWAVTLLIIVIAFSTVRPVGVSGRGLAVVALLVVNSLALLARHLPPDVPRRAALVWLTAGVVAAAALLEVSNSGSGYLFAYFLVGHAGYRLPLRPALAVAALSSLLCGAVFYFYVGPDHQALTWTFGLSTGIPVVAGILGRNRQQAVEARLQAAESAERAARAEARTAVLAERGRIARDVHDVLAHSLAGINMHLELADALMDTGDLEKVRAAHNKAQSLVRESLKQAQWTV